MRRVIVSLPVAILALLLLACPTQDGPSQNEPVNGDPTAEVYVAGFYSEGTYDVPCYWVNVEEFPQELPIGAGDGRATDIWVQDGTVYVSGYYEASLSSAERTAAYWADGSRVDLTSAGVDATATGIAASSDEMVIPGTLYDTQNTPVYWRVPAPTSPAEDLRQPLRAAAAGAAAAGVNLRGSEALVVGYYEPATTPEAKLWRDAVGSDATEEDLALGEICEVYAVDVAPDGTAYALGIVFESVGSGYEPGSSVWTITTGGSVTVSELYRETGNWTNALGVDPEDGVVYVAGYYETAMENPCYWRDGVLHDIPAEGKAMDVDATGSTVHAVGIAVTNGMERRAFVYDGTDVVELHGSSESQAVAVFVDG